MKSLIPRFPKASWGDRRIPALGILSLALASLAACQPAIKPSALETVAFMLFGAEDTTESDYTLNETNKSITLIARKNWAAGTTRLVIKPTSSCQYEVTGRVFQNDRMHDVNYSVDFSAMRIQDLVRRTTSFTGFGGIQIPTALIEIPSVRVCTITGRPREFDFPQNGCDNSLKRTGSSAVPERLTRAGQHFQQFCRQKAF